MNPFALLPPSQRLLRAARAAGVSPLTRENVDAWARASGWLISGQSTAKGH